MILYDPGVELHSYLTLCKHNGMLSEIAENYSGPTLLQGSYRVGIGAMFPGLFQQGECHSTIRHVKLVEKITTGPKYEVWSVSPTTGKPKPYGYIILLSNHYAGV